MTKELWAKLWEEFDEWYAKKFDPEWKEQQKKIEKLIAKYEK